MTIEELRDQYDGPLQYLADHYVARTLPREEVTVIEANLNWYPLITAVYVSGVRCVTEELQRTRIGK